MAVILLVLSLSLLMQGCVCSMESTDRGCRTWYSHGDDVCCDACHPGNRLVSDCGPDPKKLCVPCEANTFTTSSLSRKCLGCRQCVESLVFVEKCTTTSDTVCRCKKGLTCGNDLCTFCVKMCGTGQEPTDENSCRTCPEGTFNNQTQQKCKPWSTKCPDPDQQIVAQGDAFSDIKCSQMKKAKKPEEDAKQVWPLVLLSGFGILLICIIITLAWKIHQRRTRQEKQSDHPEQMSETMIIRPPSDEPRTLIAMECSFHEAQQEQGSSSESLVSKDSSEELLP